MEGALGDALSAHRGSIAKRLISFEEGNQRNIRMRCDSVGVFGAALLDLQQRTQPSIFLPAAAQKQAPAQLSHRSLDNASAPVPPQVDLTQSAGTFRTAPVDTSGESAAQTMATRPQVTFQNGLLGIRAENSTMGAVLRTVQRATGGLGRYVDTYPIAAARIPLPGSST